MTIQGRREPGDRAPRVRHDKGRETGHRRRGARGDAPIGTGLGHEGRPVGSGAPLSYEEVAGPNLAGVHGDAGDLDILSLHREVERASQVGEENRHLGRRVG